MSTQRQIRSTNDVRWLEAAIEKNLAHSRAKRKLAWVDIPPSLQNKAQVLQKLAWHQLSKGRKVQFAFDPIGGEVMVCVGISR